jgi:uncharacterized phage protein gp47/JayE
MAAPTITLKTRDELVSDYLAAYRTRRPDDDTSIGSPSYVDAITLVDAILPLFGAAQAAIGYGTLAGRTGEDLDDVGEEDEGVPRGEASKSAGHIVLSASGGGATISDGSLLTEPNTGTKFEFNLGAPTEDYNDGDYVPILSIDTGPLVNFRAGTALQIDSPPPGAYAACVVAEDSLGQGLTGGRTAEQDDAYRDAIRANRKRRANAGNDAEYCAEAKRATGLQIEAPFAYPCVQGPGNLAATFTVPPESTFGTRVPSSAQLTAVADYVTALMPGTDLVYWCLPVEELVDVAMSVRFQSRAKGWADLTPWPVYAAPPDQLVTAGGGAPLAFTVQNSSGVYTAQQQPSTGQKIGVFSAANGTFYRKQIASVTGTGPWDLTFATGAGESDTTYTPLAGDLVCPWSDSLNNLVTKVADYFKTLGPGEMVAAWGDNRRGLRYPPDPDSWPASTTQDLVTAVKAANAVLNAVAISGTEVTPTVNASNPRLLRVGSLAFYPL